MISKLSRALVAFCVATVLTQMLLMSYFLIRGTLNRKSATKLIALVNGIDITGNRLQKIMKQTKSCKVLQTTANLILEDYFCL